MNIKNGLKNSIRLQTGPARDIKFAYSTTPILLAILDKIGNILVYNVKPNKTFSNQLGVDLLLTIIQVIVIYVNITGSFFIILILILTSIS